LFVNYFNTFSSIWSLNFFFLFFYITLIFTITLYILSNSNEFTSVNSFKNVLKFTYLPGLNLSFIVFTPLLLILLVNLSWSSCSLMSWFGSLLWSTLQHKIIYLMLSSFSLIWLAYLISFYYSSSEVYDYTIVTYSFWLWLFFIFLSNNLITFIFLIEILSTLIMLLVITSTFSSSYFYNNLNLTRHSYFSQTLPTSYLNTIVFFFWTSLVSSLTLFVFLTLFYLQFFTFEWNTAEVIFNYLISMSNLKGVFTISLNWLLLVFCIFLKCGVVPFYIWKPMFFKGMSLHTLLFYTTFFYFFLFYFFIYFFLFYLNEIFYYNLFINLFILLLGLLILLFILCESFYLKAFIAMSSILNTLFVFLALNSYSMVDTLFLL
jgi:hypothetical protein